LIPVDLHAHEQHCTPTITETLTHAYLTHSCTLAWTREPDPLFTRPAAAANVRCFAWQWHCTCQVSAGVIVATRASQGHLNQGPQALQAPTSPDSPGMHHATIKSTKGHSMQARTVEQPT
jgi:hypothetical protein